MMIAGVLIIQKMPVLIVIEYVNTIMMGVTMIYMMLPPAVTVKPMAVLIRAIHVRGIHMIRIVMVLQARRLAGTVPVMLLIITQIQRIDVLLMAVQVGTSW